MSIPKINARYFLGLSNWISILLLGLATPANGQVVPDATMRDRSVVNYNGRTWQINGGTTAGGNLFHSFSEFSVPTGNEVFFNNTPTIENIITRVTGRSISNIDGLIRARGNANLFLLNPNGIVFGPNARLDIGGSFLGSTADSLLFENGRFFSATEPNQPPLLTINIPIGLQYGSNPGEIINRALAENASGSTVGLQVRPHQAIALIGGSLNLEGGLLNAPNGSIELGSVDTGTIKLTSTDGNWQVSYPAIIGRRNISLSRGAIASTSGEGGGRLQIFGANVSLAGRSQLLADTLGTINGKGIDIHAQNLRVLDASIIGSSSFGTGNGGHLNIQADDSIELSGSADINSFIFGGLTGMRRLSNRENGGLFVGSENSGYSGNINLSTRQLNLGNGALIVADIYDRGSGGYLSINAVETIEIGESGISYGVLGSGNAASLKISSRQLILRESAFLDLVNFPGSTGRGGNIFVKAEDIEIRDATADLTTPTTSRIATFALGSGNGGDITIDTNRLLLLNGGVINTENAILLPFLLLSEGGRSGDLNIRASESLEVIGTAPTVASSRLISSIGSGTTNNQRAGDITIETKRFRVMAGGRVTTSTFSSGSGGNILINASEVVELSGNAFPITGLQGIGSRSRTFSGEIADASEQLGDAGNIVIIAPQVIIRDENVISVESFGLSQSGNLTVLTDVIRVENGGSITATTALGEGGNITLQATDSLQLRGAGEINAEADGTGNGGNIEIDVGTLTLLTGSRLNANAFIGNGGNIEISTRGLFQSPNSSITASSQLGIDGIVFISNPEFEPSSALVNLSSELLDTTHQINVSCASTENSFTIIGRGGLPDSPIETINPVRVWRDLNDYTGETSDRKESGDRDPSTIAESTTAIPLIVEATGWIKHPNGRIELVANSKNLSTLEYNCQEATNSYP